MNDPQERSKRALTLAMGEALMSLGAFDGLALIISAQSAAVATVFNMTGAQMADLNTSTATFVGMKIREANGKAIKA